MNILLSVGDERLYPVVDQFITGWHDHDDSAQFTVVYGDATYGTLQRMWNSDSPLPDNMIATDVHPQQAGRILNNYARTTHQVFISGMTDTVTPDGGQALLQGFTGSDTTDYASLLDKAAHIIADNPLSVIVTSTAHVTGLDGTLAADVAFEGMDEDAIYDTVRDVSQKMRDAHSFGDSIGAHRPHRHLQLAGDTSVPAGKLPGGALWGAGVEALYRAGATVDAADAVIDRHSNYMAHIRAADLIVCMEQAVHSWTLDDVFMTRLIAVNQFVGKPVLAVTMESSVTKREAGDNGIDGIYVADPHEQLLGGPLWVEAGIRCARTWTMP